MPDAMVVGVGEFESTREEYSWYWIGVLNVSLFVPVIALEVNAVNDFLDGIREALRTLFG